MNEIELTYCPRCTEPLQKKEFNLLVCQKCDYHYYINPRPTGSVLFENNNGEILLVKRKYDPLKGYLDLPGGFVDLGETVEQTCRREIKEELGLSLSKPIYFSSYQDVYEFKDVVYPIVNMLFTSPYPKNQTVVVSDDIASASFFKRQDIPYAKIAFDWIKKALKEYINASEDRASF